MSDPLHQEDAPSKKERTDPLLKPKNYWSVISYLVILFIAAFILLGVAWLVQERDNHAFNQPDSQIACVAVHEGFTHHH